MYIEFMGGIWFWGLSLHTLCQCYLTRSVWIIHVRNFTKHDPIV